MDKGSLPDQADARFLECGRSTGAEGVEELLPATPPAAAARQVTLNIAAASNNRAVAEYTEQYAQCDSW